MDYLGLVIFILVVIFSVLRRASEENRRAGRRPFEPPPLTPYPMAAVPTGAVPGEPLTGELTGYGEQAGQVTPARGAAVETVLAPEPAGGWNLPGQALVQGVILSVVLGPPRALCPYRPGAPGSTGPV